MVGNTPTDRTSIDINEPVGTTGPAVDHARAHLDIVNRIRGEVMATWNIGPFDNDDAVDWCASLEAADPNHRTEVVRQALEPAAHGHADVTVCTAARAIAAAATMLQAITETQPSNSPYAPRFLLGRGEIEASPPLCALALDALDAIISDGSKWHQQWAQNVEFDEALEGVRHLRASLAAVAPGAMPRFRRAS